MTSNMYDLSGQAVLSTRDIVWNYGECGEVISGKKTSWSEVGSKLTGKQRESKNHKLKEER